MASVHVCTDNYTKQKHKTKRKTCKHIGIFVKVGLKVFSCTASYWYCSHSRTQLSELCSTRLCLISSARHTTAMSFWHLHFSDRLIY